MGKTIDLTGQRFGRLIDANAVVTIQTFNEMTEDWGIETLTVSQALDKFADEGCPSTIDAVPVVRCKDCKYFKWGDYCTQDKMEHSKCRPDEFCSCGEKNDGGDTDGQDD